MKLVVHHYHHMDPEQERLLLDMRERLIMISAEVQAMLDKARQSVVLVNSVHAGMTALRMQVQELTDRVAQIPAPQPATDETPAQPGLSDEDRGAILEVTADLDRTITTLAQDIPTNVQTVVAPKPVNQPTPDQQQSHEEDAKAASQAQPLPGTGDPQAAKDAADQAASRTIPAATDQEAARNAKNEPLPDGMIGSTPNSTATAPDNAPPRVVLDTTDGKPADQHDTGVSGLQGNPLDQSGSRNPIPQPGLPTPSTTRSDQTSGQTDGGSSGSASASGQDLDPDGKPATGGTPGSDPLDMNGNPPRDSKPKEGAGSNQGFSA